MSMDMLESFRRSVELCNTRDVILKEYQQYTQAASLELETLEEYKQRYYDEHAPKGCMVTVALNIAVFAVWCLLWFVLGGSATDGPVGIGDLSCWCSFVQPCVQTGL